MSLYHETYRRCASVALVLALVLIALPSMLNAQTAAPNAQTVQSDDTFPKVEVFLGYQWLNPGGNVPDRTPPPAGPLAIKLPSMVDGFGANVAYNFTKNAGVRSQLTVRTGRTASPMSPPAPRAKGHLARRGCGRFRAHADRIRAHQARWYPPQPRRRSASWRRYRSQTL